MLEIHSSVPIHSATVPRCRSDYADALAREKKLQKLEDCGVFLCMQKTVSGLYAQQNRQEWDMQGREVVAQMIAATPSCQTE